MTTPRRPHKSQTDNPAMDTAIGEEQSYVDTLFQRLDDEVNRSNQRLADVMKDVDPNNPDPEALVRRETEYHGLNQKLDRLNLAQLGLVFGRIDVETEPQDRDNPVPGNPDLDRRYIGRMGLDDRDDDYRTLLLDWRARWPGPSTWPPLCSPRVCICAAISGPGVAPSPVLMMRCSPVIPQPR